MIDDFFAEDFNRVKKKAKREKHKSKKKERDQEKVKSHTSVKVPSLLDFDELEHKPKKEANLKPELISTTKQLIDLDSDLSKSGLDTFESELGISINKDEDAHDKTDDDNNYIKDQGYTDDDNDEDYDYQDNDSIQMTQADVEIVELDDSNENEGEDEFDLDLKKYQTQIQMSSNKLLERIQSDLNDVIEINGERVSLADVLININLIIEMGEFKSDTYQVKLKSGKIVGKVIKTFVTQFNNQFGSNIIEDINDLVIYFPKLNLSLESNMSFGTLVRCKDQLQTKYDSNKNKFAITCDGKLILKDEAEQLSKEREAQLERGVQSIQNDYNVQLIKIKIIDNVTMNNDIELEMNNSNSLNELIDLYRIKRGFPHLLDLIVERSNEEGEIYPITTQWEVTIIGDILTSPNHFLSIKYNENELKDLQGDYDDSPLGIVSEQLGDSSITKIDVSSTKDTREGGQSETYFPVTLLVSEKIKYKVEVKPTTQIKELIEYFISRTSDPIDDISKVALSFDNEPLPLDEEIQFTEIEEDDIIDVIIR